MEAAESGGERVQLVAYRLMPTGVRLVRSEPRRPWMDATADGYANRCLPLLIANQSGWLVLNDATVRLRWDGTAATSAVTVTYDEEQPGIPALSHFGSGIVTWRLPYLFRTSPGWNLVVRGAPNNPKRGAQPLDAVVETDWTTSPFTVNWQLLAVDEDVVVSAGEPLCMVFPQRRGELERVEPEVRDLREDPDLAEAVDAWSRSRAGFLQDLPVAGTEAHARGWQRDYFQGRDGEARRQEHQTRLRLRDFLRDGPDT